MNDIKISICIPAYKRVNYLERLLDSIAVQTFRNFEVIVSDDSPDNSVKELIALYGAKINVFYYHNAPSLGTPANWNFAISKAKSGWIKLMHDDDWFASPNSLQIFADNTKRGSKFIFSAYTLHYENDTEKNKHVYFPFFGKKRLYKEPLTLMAENIIGQPSVGLVSREINVNYDERMKWRVDIDYYIRLLFNEKRFCYVPVVLINIGINEGQVTNECFENPFVELPEGFLMLEKYGTKPLNNIMVYDAWWRLLRNMNINSPAKLTSYVNKQWPVEIIQITRRLGNIPNGLLKWGALSKTLMFLSFIFKGSKQ